MTWCGVMLKKDAQGQNVETLCIQVGVCVSDCQRRERTKRGRERLGYLRPSLRDQKFLHLSTDWFYLGLQAEI